MTERETIRLQISVPANNGTEMSRIRTCTMGKLLSMPEIAEHPHLKMLIATAKDHRSDISLPWLVSELTKHFGLNVVEEKIVAFIERDADNNSVVNCKCWTTIELYI